MKKHSRLYSRVILAAACVFTLAGCGKKSDVASVSFDDNYQSVWKVGEIDFSSLTFSVTHKNGVVETVPVDVSMIEEKDLYKFYQPGEWKVKINYDDNYYNIVDFTIVENSFSEDLYLKSETFVYDGMSHSLEIVGPLPEGTKVYYPLGNSFTNYSAAPYEIKCVLSKTGYKTKELTGHLTILKSEFSKELLDQIEFEDAEYTYDGFEKKIEAKNLPEGCSIDYTIIDERGSEVRGNAKTNAGVYTVVGHLKCSNPNYKEIPDIHATLTIKKALYDISEISFEDKIVSYEPGTVYSMRVTNENMLPAGLYVDYGLNEYTEAGEYEVTATFKSGDNFLNHEYIDPMTATLTILKKDIDLSSVKINKPQIVTFNNEELDFNVDVPAGVIVNKQYFDSTTGALVEKPTNVGVYNVELSYSVDPSIGVDNYRIINAPTDKGVLICQKKVIDLYPFNFDTQEYTFDNCEYAFDVCKDKEGKDYDEPLAIPEELEITETYSKDGEQLQPDVLPLSVGSYQVEFNVGFKEGYLASNYEIKNGPRTSGTLIVNKIKIDMSGVEIKEQKVQYSGEQNEYKVENVPEGVNYTIYYEGEEILSTIDVGSYAVYVDFQLDEGHSSETYEMVNVPNGSTNLIVTKKQFDIAGLSPQDIEVTEDGNPVVYETSNIINYESLSSYITPVITYYKTGSSTPLGGAPTDPGFYYVKITFVLKDAYPSDKYVVVDTLGTGEKIAYIAIKAAE